MPRRLVRAAVLITTFGAGLAAVPAASAHAIPLRVGPAGISHIGMPSASGAGASLGATTVDSTNWSGYAETGGGTYTSVTTSWFQPSVNCSVTPSSYAAFWDGLDGYSSSTVEQDGTLAECVSSGRHGAQSAKYLGWYETYPNPMYGLGGTVAPGDFMTATVTATSSTKFLLTLSDKPASGAKAWSASTTQTLRKAAALSSAEVIAEAPSSGRGVLPLADFGTMSFSGSTVDGAQLANGADTVAIDMVSSRNQPEATPSALSGGGFSVTWQ